MKNLLFLVFVSKLLCKKNTRVWLDICSYYDYLSNHWVMSSVLIGQLDVCHVPLTFGLFHWQICCDMASVAGTALKTNKHWQMLMHWQDTKRVQKTGCGALINTELGCFRIWRTMEIKMDVRKEEKDGLNIL